MISTNQLELFSTVPTTVPNTVLYWFLGADGPRTKLLKLTESFSNSETFSNKSVNVSSHAVIAVMLSSSYHQGYLPVLLYQADISGLIPDIRSVGPEI